MKRNCLYCYLPLDGDGDGDFHKKCSKTFFGKEEAPTVSYTLDEMSELAKNVVEQSIAVPGVQAKLSMQLIKESLDQTKDRLTVVGALGGNYIFKPPSANFVEMPENEHVTMRIAEAFGINVVASSLIRLKSGEFAYITKRIDRTVSGEKIHMIDMFQITEAFDKYIGTMERVGKALNEHSANTLLDKLFFFELAIFSFLTGNNDMHLKNFSMIRTPSGWSLAPAYDLLNVHILNPEDKDEFALLLGGKKRNFSRAYFERFGEGMGLTGNQLKGVFNRFLQNKPKAIEWIAKSFLSEGMKAEYVKLLSKRYDKLYQS
ncbi:MAG: HipA domain-containing protein [Crocinitomicaceae bacterium]